MRTFQRIVRGCIFSIKNEGRDKSFLFWSVAYPILMAIFFKLAFGGVMNGEFQKIEIGVDPQNPYISIMETIDVLQVNPLTEDEGKANLKDGKIIGFVDSENQLLVQGSGVSQTVVKEILDSFGQIQAIGLPYENFRFDQKYINQIQQKQEIVALIFYSLIGMVSLYGMYSGIQMVYGIQANLSTFGARIQTTPMGKGSRIVSGFIVGIGLNILCNGLLLLFIRYVLKLHLFNDVPRSLLIIMMANFCGVALGILISASNKMDERVKTMMATITSLVLSFAAGMTGTSLKLSIDRNLPLFNRLNPVAIVTDNMYRLNLLESRATFGAGLAILVAETCFLLILSFFFLRRQRYDSL